MSKFIVMYLLELIKNNENTSFLEISSAQMHANVLT